MHKLPRRERRDAKRKGNHNEFLAFYSGTYCHLDLLYKKKNETENEIKRVAYMKQNERVFEKIGLFGLLLFMAGFGMIMGMESPSKMVAWGFFAVGLFICLTEYTLRKIKHTPSEECKA